ncbi:MAG: GNAT family N-acetyltransferase [Bacteroidales bacterium]|nr:GNAT family N-acetyltransferase [Candidatus Methylacidiphilales bacterium]NJO53500.1 GNAT family N-acetyltransferase [Bacteroidales bacterium]
MHIDVIDSGLALATLRDQWEEVYEADPHAHFFLSYKWLTNWLDAAPSPWFVLAARPSAEPQRHVAYLPLRVSSKKDKTGKLNREVTMAGSRLSDYTGFLCRPEYEELALPAFANHLKALDWQVFQLENIRASERRLELFLSRFESHAYTSKSIDHISKIDGIDNNLCPLTELPDTWEEYLTTKLSANMRQKLRRFLRAVESPESGFRFTLPDASTIDRDLDVLLRLWDTKWRPRKGAKTDDIVSMNRNMLKRCFNAGTLFLPMLWQGERPLGGLASFLDPVKRSVLFYMAGRDESFEDLPTGLVLHAYSIRRLIADGFRIYDFLRGNEPYKYSFGVVEHRIVHIELSRQGVTEQAEASALAALFKQATEHHQHGRHVEAEDGYRRILDTNPRHAGALYGLGQMLAARGDHGTAEQLFSVFVSHDPTSHKGWLRLAATQQARDKFSAAADAYRKAIELCPGVADAHGGLGHVLARLGQREEAVAALETAVRLKPNFIEAEVSLGNMLEDLGRLSPSDKIRFARANVALADRRRAAGATSPAASLYRRAIAFDPTSAAAHHGLGLVLQTIGDNAQAAQCYRRVLELDPNHVEARALMSIIDPAWTSRSRSQRRRASAAPQKASPPWNSHPPEIPPPTLN